MWITLSAKVIGGAFKFLDYYSSVGFRPDEIPMLSSSDPLKRILDEARLPRTEEHKDGLRAALLSVSEHLSSSVQ